MVYQIGNQLKVGSTQCGKSYSEMIEVVEAAREQMAIVVLDPHERSLAWSVLLQLIARGQQKRVIWDQLDELKRTPKIRFLLRSHSHDSLERAKEHYEAAEQFAELLCRRREKDSLATSPQTEEWVMKAILLLLNQPKHHPASDLRYAFRVGHPKFEQLRRNCQDPDLQHEFDQIAAGVIKPGQFNAARRLINGVCEAPHFIARCGNSFSIPRFLSNCGILLVQGGAVSQPVMQTIFGSFILEVIQYIRKRGRANPRVLLVLDEATNCSLIGAAGHEVRALAECQKMGLDIHILVQSLNFPTPHITDGVLTNCVRHSWFFSANAAVSKKAAEDLGDSDLEREIRRLKRGQRYVKERTEVYFDEVPTIANPWTLPGLAERKARRAIEEIRKRPEYGGDDECPPSSETPPSCGGPPRIPAQSDTSSITSPAKRRRIERSKLSDNKGSSGKSEQ